MKARKATELTGPERKLIEREEESWICALLMDPQYAIRQAVLFEQLLARPRRLSKPMAAYYLSLKMALYRERHGLGRPWTVHQIMHAYYARRSFRRRETRPMTPGEWRDAAQRQRTRPCLDHLKRLSQTRTPQIAVSADDGSRKT